MIRFFLSVHPLIWYYITFPTFNWVELIKIRIIFLVYCYCAYFYRYFYFFFCSSRQITQQPTIRKSEIIFRWKDLPFLWIPCPLNNLAGDSSYRRARLRGSGSSLLRFLPSSYTIFLTFYCYLECVDDWVLEEERDLYSDEIRYVEHGDWATGQTWIRGKSSLSYSILCYPGL